MSKRSIWKGPFVDYKLLNKVNKSSNRSKKIKTWARNSTVLPNFIGLTFLVYNGRKFNSVFITESMIGKKLGEFSHTRKFVGHLKNKK